MKLYNRSPIDDKVLKAVLAKAARSVGARQSKVLVEIGHGDHLRGHANNYIWKLIGKRKIKCEDWVRIILPTWRIQYSPHQYWRCWYKGDPINLAQVIYDLARHEFAHIRDYQHGGEQTMPWSRQGKSGRRPRWAERPEEQRAMAACEDADALGRGHEWAADEILDLAIALEGLSARDV